MKQGKGADHWIDSKWIFFAIIVALLALPVFGCLASAEIAHGNEVVINSFQRVQDYTLTTQGIIMLADDYLLQEMDAGWQVLAKYPKAIAIASGTHGIYLCNREQRDSIIRIGKDGSCLKSYELDEGIRVKHMVCTFDGVVVAVENDMVDTAHSMAHDGGVYLLDPESGSLTKLINSFTYDLTSDGGENIYVLHENMHDAEWTLSCVNTSSGYAEELCQVLPYSFNDIFVSESRVYYCDASGNIATMDFSDGQSETLVFAARSNVRAFAYVQYRDGILHAFGYDANEDVWRRFEFDLNTIEAGKGRTLTIVNYIDASDNARMDYMIRWFGEFYPNVDLEFITIDTAQLATRLMAGDSDIDIIYGAAGMIGHYAESGAYYPLDEVEGLSMAMSCSGFLDYRPTMTYDGQLFGVADQVSFYAFSLNEALLERLEIDWPEGFVTWAELADWAIAELEGTDYQLLSNLAVNPAYQYVDMMLQEVGEVQLDTKEFRETMDAYRRLWQAGLLGTGGIRNSENALASIQELYMGAYAPLPTIGGVSACSADVSGFYVSVASENLDLVETFLTEYVSEECQNKAEYGYPYYMLIDKIAGYSRVWQEIDMKAGVFDYRDTTELLRVTSYDNIVLKGRNHEMNRAFGYNSELKAYLDGEIEIDTYIQYVQPKLDLIQYE